MSRRLLPTLALLACGLVALVWGLASLQRIFAQEREDARAALSSRRTALEGLAREALRQRLAQALAQAQPALQAVREGAGTPADGLYLRVRGRQVLPRPGREGPHGVEGVLVVPPRLEGPLLVGGRWYLEPRGAEVHGVALVPQALLEEVVARLRRRRLLGADARVHLASPAASFLPAEELRVEVALPEWTQAERDIEARYRLKSGLILTCGALALGIVGLAVLAQRRKERFVELKSDFVAAVSHELRTPLASIRLLAETLERRLGGQPEARDYPSRILHEAEELSFLVENLLSFHRVDKGRWQPVPEGVRVGELASLLRAELASHARTEVELSVDGEEVEVWADPALLRLVLSNLARNACAYNQRSPVRLGLHARASPRPTLLFSDNGMGIPEEAWERVFDDFQRLSGPGREARGSGLGLALCRRVMRLHHGHIQVAASGPEGTTFVLSFPPPAP